MSNLYIMHYGVGHDKGGHSGHYPWGSGENPYGGQKKLTKKDARRFVNTATKSFKQASGSVTQQINFINARSTIEYAAKNPRSVGIDGEWTDENIEKATDYLWNEVKNFRNIFEPYYNNYRKNQMAARAFVKDFINEYDTKDLYLLNSRDPNWKYARDMIDSYINGETDEVYMKNMPESAREWIKDELKTLTKESD